MSFVDVSDTIITDPIYHVLTDHIRIESLMEDIIVIYFCEKEKISDFQEIIFPRLPFDKKLQILEQILRITNLETNYGDLVKTIGDFSKHRNAISHRRQGWRISNGHLTYDLSRRKDGKLQPYRLSRDDTEKVWFLGDRCVVNLKKLVYTIRSKYY